MAFRCRPVFEVVSGLHFIFLFLSVVKDCQEWSKLNLSACMSTRSFFKLAHNGLQLQEVGDFYRKC